MWRTNLAVALVVLGTLGLYTAVANMIPQVEADVPEELVLGADVSPEEMVAAGEDLFMGSGGGCTACHGLGTRAPDLLGVVGSVCETREPGMSCKDYLHASLVDPGSYVVEGFQPIMPDMSRTLSDAQIWSLVAFLQTQGGQVTVTAADLAPAATPSDPSAHGGDIRWRGRVGSPCTRDVYRDGPRRHDHISRLYGLPRRGRLARGGGAGDVGDGRSGTGLYPPVDSRTRGRRCPGLRTVCRYDARDVRRSADGCTTRSTGQLHRRRGGVMSLLFQFGIPLLPPLIGLDSAPVPASVVFQFMMTALVGVLLYVSADETRWSQFKQPFNAVAVDADKKLLRTILLIALPVFIGFLTYRQVSASVGAPASLRSIHPARTRCGTKATWRNTCAPGIRCTSGTVCPATAIDWTAVAISPVHSVRCPQTSRAMER